MSVVPRTERLASKAQHGSPHHQILHAIQGLPFWASSPLPSSDSIIEGALFTRGGQVYLVHLSHDASKRCFRLITRVQDGSNARSIPTEMLRVQEETTWARVLPRLGDNHVAVATTIPWCPHCGVDEATTKDIFRDFRIAVEAVDRSLRQASR